MIIIGINSAYHEQSAAVIVDGQLAASAEEERFNRVKHGKHSRVDNADVLPWRALEYCLQAAGVTFADVDRVAYSFDPWARYLHNWPDKMDGVADGDFGSRDGEERFFRSHLRARDLLSTRMPHAQVCFLPHHLCHAASAFLASPFTSAGILVVDG